jgi:hypothetical protein
LRPRLDDLLKNTKITHTDGDELKKTQLDENWLVRVKETKNQDYCQYEIYSEIECPNEEQLEKLQVEAQVFCHPKIEQYREGENLTKLMFGLKIGCKINDKENTWIEKWANFEIGPRNLSSDLNTTLDTSIVSESDIEDEESKRGT